MPLLVNRHSSSLCLWRMSQPSIILPSSLIAFHWIAGSYLVPFSTRFVEEIKTEGIVCGTINPYPPTRFLLRRQVMFLSFNLVMSQRLPVSLRHVRGLMSTAYGAWTGRLDNRQLSKEIGKLEHPGSGLGCDYLRGMIYGSLQGTNFINKAVGKAELRAMTKTDSRFKFDHDWTHYPGHRKLYYHTMKTTVFVVFLNSINPSYSTLILTIILFYLQIIITMTKP